MRIIWLTKRHADVRVRVAFSLVIRARVLERLGGEPAAVDVAIIGMGMGQWRVGYCLIELASLSFTSRK
jgi:hypothetical protein